jgi:hypothetical protein
VRRPAVRLDQDEAIVAFECAVDLIFNRPEDMASELSEVIGHPAARMVKRFDSPPEQTVVLLWCLSGAKSVTLNYDANSCLIYSDSGTRGISDGVLVSQFAPQQVPGCNPLRTLTMPGGPRRATGSSFIMAYSMARNMDRSGALAEVVAILYEATTPRQFSQLISPKVGMGKPQAERLEEIVFESKDPVRALYRKLVPRWMNKSEFSRVFGPSEVTALSPSLVKRSTILNKLVSQPFYPQQ